MNKVAKPPHSVNSSLNSVTEICTFCGQPLPASSGPGRRRVFHDPCGQINRFLDWIEGQLNDLPMSPRARARLRRRLFSIINSAARVPQPRDRSGRFAPRQGGAL